jgi:hypothetical protein
LQSGKAVGDLVDPFGFHWYLLRSAHIILWARAARGASACQATAFALRRESPMIADLSAAADRAGTFRGEIMPLFIDKEALRVALDGDLSREWHADGFGFGAGVPMGAR